MTRQRFLPKNTEQNAAIAEERSLESMGNETDTTTSTGTTSFTSTTPFTTSTTPFTNPTAGRDELTLLQKFSTEFEKRVGDSYAREGYGAGVASVALPLAAYYATKKCCKRRDRPAAADASDAADAALAAALQTEDTQEVIKLLKGTSQKTQGKANPDTPIDNDGRYALTVAAARGNLKIVEELLKAGANPNVLDRNSGSALGLSYYNAQGPGNHHVHTAIFNKLLEHKDINPILGIMEPNQEQERNLSLKTKLEQAQNRYRSTGHAQAQHCCLLQ